MLHLSLFFYPINLGSMDPVDSMFLSSSLTLSEISHKNFSSQSAPSHDLYSNLSHKYVHGRNPPRKQKIQVIKFQCRR